MGLLLSVLVLGMNLGVGASLFQLGRHLGRREIGNGRGWYLPWGVGLMVGGVLAFAAELYGDANEFKWKIPAFFLVFLSTGCSLLARQRPTTNTKFVVSRFFRAYRAANNLEGPEPPVRRR